MYFPALVISNIHKLMHHMAFYVLVNIGPSNHRYITRPQKGDHFVHVLITYYLTGHCYLKRLM